MTDLVDTFVARVRRGPGRGGRLREGSSRRRTGPDRNATVEGSGSVAEFVYLGDPEVDLGVGETTPEHVASHDPASVLVRVARDRRLLDLLLAEKHHVAEDQYCTCAAVTQERDGGVDGAGDESGPCDCGRGERVAAYLAVLAEAYEETT